MSLKTSLAATKSSLARAAGPFAALRGRVPEVARFENPSALVAALDLSSSLSLEERGSTVSALVRDAQSDPRSLAPTLLLVAFAPMMLGLRRRIEPIFDEDVDQRVLTAFLVAVRTVRAGPYTATALRWATEKTVFAESRAASRMPRTTSFDEERYAADLFGGEAERKAAVAEVFAALESAENGELVEALLTTSAGDESLKAYVARTRAGEHVSVRDAVYARLRRARSAALDELRHRFVRAA